MAPSKSRLFASGISLSNGTRVSRLTSHTDSAPDIGATVPNRNGCLGVDAPFRPAAAVEDQVVLRPVRLTVSSGLASVVSLRLLSRNSKVLARETGPAQS